MFELARKQRARKYSPDGYSFYEKEPKLNTEGFTEIIRTKETSEQRFSLIRIGFI